jgi:ribosomal protein L10
MKAQKEVYYAKVENLSKSNQFIGQVDISGLESKLVQDLKFKMHEYSLTCLKSKVNIVNKLLPVSKGDSLIFWSNSKNNLLTFLKQNVITSYSYYNVGDRAQEDLTIPKGNLRLKAGTILALFEKYGSIKLTKGMIELLSPISLAKKGEKINKESAKILQLLNKKIKVNQSKINYIYDIKNNKVFSPEFIQILSNNRIETQLIKTISGICNNSRFSTVTSTPTRLAKIIHYGFNKFPKKNL